MHPVYWNRKSSLFWIAFFVPLFASPLHSQTRDSLVFNIWGPDLISKPEDIPTLTAFLPVQNNQSAIVICPGGGYAGLAMDHEGYQVAKWLA